MKSNKIYWVIAIILGVVFGTQQWQMMSVPAVDVKAAQSMNQQGALLLDVREPEEYKAVHAVNAQLIPLGQLGDRLKEIETYKDKPVVVICRSGNRSAKAVSMLQGAGYTNVNNVSGGTNAWEKAGLETIKM
ncbi:MAG: rhodanese-like domain-containing protein [Gallionellaceae bacterium]|nr:rhodanese-like domain-containing protein [Gallionellaceae bacterium]